VDLGTEGEGVSELHAGHGEGNGGGEHEEQSEDTEGSPRRVGEIHHQECDGD